MPFPGLGVAAGTLLAGGTAVTRAWLPKKGCSQSGRAGCSWCGRLLTRLCWQMGGAVISSRDWPWTGGTGQGGGHELSPVSLCSGTGGQRRRVTTARLSHSVIINNNRVQKAPSCYFGRHRWSVKVHARVANGRAGAGDHPDVWALSCGPWGFESSEELCKGDGSGEKGWEVPPEAGCALGQGEKKELPGWNAPGAVVQRRLVCSLLSPQGLRGALKDSGIKMRSQTCRDRGHSAVGQVVGSSTSLQAGWHRQPWLRLQASPALSQAPQPRAEEASW